MAEPYEVIGVDKLLLIVGSLPRSVPVRSQAADLLVEFRRVWRMPPLLYRCRTRSLLVLRLHLFGGSLQALDYNHPGSLLAGSPCLQVIDCTLRATQVQR